MASALLPFRRCASYRSALSNPRKRISMDSSFAGLISLVVRPRRQVLVPINSSRGVLIEIVGPLVYFAQRRVTIELAMYDKQRNVGL